MTLRRAALAQGRPFDGSTSSPQVAQDRQGENDPPTPFGLCRAGNPQINDRAKYLDSRLRGNDKKKKPCHK